MNYWRAVYIKRCKHGSAGGRWVRQEARLLYGNKLGGGAVPSPLSGMR